jgi:hypothetical protein
MHPFVLILIPVLVPGSVFRVEGLIVLASSGFQKNRTRAANVEPETRNSEPGTENPELIFKPNDYQKV